MITITNKEILDYLVRKIIKEKRATPKYIHIDENLKIFWCNGKITTKHIISRMSINSSSMILSLVDYHGGEIARIDYVIDKIIDNETQI